MSTVTNWNEDSDWLEKSKHFLYPGSFFSGKVTVVSIGSLDGTSQGVLFKTDRGYAAIYFGNQASTFTVGKTVNIHAFVKHHRREGDTEITVLERIRRVG